jgi:hypothetical protein
LQPAKVEFQASWTDSFSSLTTDLPTSLPMSKLQFVVLTKPHTSNAMRTFLR